MPQPRIFVTLTLEEAACLCRVAPGPEASAARAIDKVRSAYQGALASPEPPALSAEPLLRAKDYRPRERQLPMAKAAIRPARPQPPPRAASAEASRAEYVPHRDEAGGIYS